MAAWGQAGYQSAGGEQLCCVSLVFLGFYFSFSSGCLSSHYNYYFIIIILFQLLNRSYLNPASFTFFPILLPIPLQGWQGV